MKQKMLFVIIVVVVVVLAVLLLWVFKKRIKRAIITAGVSLATP